MSHDRSRFGLSAPQILGGALAAASAAVASSWLGVAGTVVGAVVVSIVASVGTALYQHSLERSTQVLRETLPPRLVRAGATGTTQVLAAVPAEDNEGPAAGTASEPTSPGVEKDPIRWRGVAVTAIATLALGLSLVTSLESMLGKPVSSLTGGDDDGRTTLTQLVAPSDDDDVSDQPADPSGGTPSEADNNTDPAPTDTDGGTPAPTDDTGTEPTEPTPTEPSPTEPTPTEPTPTTPTEPTPTEPTGSTPTTSGATTGSGENANVEAI